MNISREYLRRCKDSVAGVKEVYLFSYINYSRTNITIVDNALTAFPNNTLYVMEGLLNASFTDTATESPAGYEYAQTLNLTFSHISDYYNFTKVVQGIVRALVLDNNGFWWLLGTYNGLDVSNYGRQTGSSKSELNGYQITFTGRERVEAPRVKGKEFIQPYTVTAILASGGTILASSGILASETEIVS